MEEVVIGLETAGLRLTPVAPDAHRPVEALTVTISCPGLTASHTSHEYPDFTSLARFFAELADNWRGWQGERSYESLEGDFKIRATHNGHVLLHIDLASLSGFAEWHVQVVVQLDPGEQLSRVATEVAELLSA
ncbi:MAG: DUF6228 family protein [Geodermatophilaceae bacterium]